MREQNYALVEKWISVYVWLINGYIWATCLATRKKKQKYLLAQRASIYPRALSQIYTELSSEADDNE